MGEVFGTGASDAEARGSSRHPRPPRGTTTWSTSRRPPASPARVRLPS